MPWSREREAAAAVNARWAAGDGTSGSSVRRRAGQPAHVTHDLRFYARGLFASPAVTSWRGLPQDPQPGPLDRLRGALWGGTAVLASLLDYPLRRLTGGLVWAAAEFMAAAAAAMAGLLGRGPLRNPWGFSRAAGACRAEASLPPTRSLPRCRRPAQQRNAAGALRTALLRC